MKGIMGVQNGLQSLMDDIGVLSMTLQRQQNQQRELAPPVESVKVVAAPAWSAEQKPQHRQRTISEIDAEVEARLRITV